MWRGWVEFADGGAVCRSRELFLLAFSFSRNGADRVT